MSIRPVKRMLESRATIEGAGVKLTIELPPQIRESE